MSSSVQNIIDQLNSLNWYKVDDLYFHIDDNIFCVGINTRWLYYDCINRSAFIEEMNELKRLFDKFLIVYPDFKSYLYNKQIVYKLWYTEEKSFSFTICEEMNGTVYWSQNIKE